MEQRVAKLEADVDMLRNDVVDIKTRLAVAESNIEEMSRRLEKIDNNTSWTVRLLLSGIIIAVLNLILKGGVNL